MDKEKKHFEIANIEKLKMLLAAEVRPVTPSAAVLLSNDGGVDSVVGFTVLMSTVGNEK